MGEGWSEPVAMMHRFHRQSSLLEHPKWKGLTKKGISVDPSHGFSSTTDDSFNWTTLLGAMTRCGDPDEKTVAVLRGAMTRCSQPVSLRQPLNAWNMPCDTHVRAHTHSCAQTWEYDLPSFTDALSAAIGQYATSLASMSRMRCVAGRMGVRVLTRV